MTLARWRASRRRWWPVLVAIAIIAAVVVGDLVASPQREAVTSLMIAAPLLCGLTMSAMVTSAIGVLATAAAASVLVWDQKLDSGRSWVALCVVALASGFAVLTAVYRQRLHRDEQRMRVLADLATVVDGGGAAEEIAAAIAALFVSRLVDFCAIDLLRADGRMHRLAALASSGLDGLGAPGDPVSDDEQVTVLERAGLQSAVIVPLAPRGAGLGRLVLGVRTAGLQSPGDVQYAESLAGRVALALDNATLSEELSSTERRLEVILGSVDAAVTVRDRNGRMVYANQAAADLLKLPDAAAVMAMPPGGLIGRFDVYTEAGEPLELTDMLGTRLLRGESTPPAITVRNVVKTTGEERWLLNKARGVPGPDGRVELAVNLIEDVTEAKRSEIAQRLLARTGRTMAEASDLASTLQAMAEAAVPGLADWAGADLLDEAGHIRAFAIAHRDPEKVRLGRRLRTEWPPRLDDAGGVAAVIRTGKPTLIHEIDDQMLEQGAVDGEHLAVLRAVGLNSVMIAPIVAGERVLGALSFVSSTSRRFDERDLELACDLGRQVGIVIDSAKLHAEQLHIARTLQAGLIPRSLPRIEGWQLCSAYRAAGRANDVGGDFYDVILADRGWVAIIGDVVGKGAEAAALTALARHTMAAIIESTGDVGEAFEVLNRRLRHRGDYKGLCTVCAVQVSSGDSARVFSAGHPLPLLSSEASVRIVGRPSPMLGFVDELRISETLIEVRPGDRLVLYTDGVLDAIGPLDRFGETRLLETVHRLADGETAAADILTALDRFADEEQADDIAVLSLTRSPVSAPALVAGRTPA